MSLIDDRTRKWDSLIELAEGEINEGEGIKNGRDISSFPSFDSISPSFGYFRGN